jgi:hypothetical protein
MAAHAEMSILQIDALRLSGMCHVAGCSEDRAAKAWVAAQAIGTKLDPEQRRVSTLAEVTTALNALLDRRVGVPQAVQGRSGSDAKVFASP